MELGDRVEQALSTVGISKHRVSSWLGKDCGCAERQEKLNQLSRWAKRVVRGKLDNAKEYFDRITDN